MIPPRIEEVTDEERDRIFTRVAEEVVKRRYEVPVLLALEMHRPLTFLGSQLMIVLTPALAPAFGLQNLGAIVALMQGEGNLDRLLERIEELAARRDGLIPVGDVGDEGRAA